MAKKYFQIKLQTNFFTTKEIKRLRKVAGGDTFVIIYLKMQLLSLQNEGKLYLERCEETFAQELALELDEEVDNVELTFQYLLKHGLIEIISDEEFLLPQTVNLIASESDSAERVRKHRNKNRMLQCNVESQQVEEKALHCNTGVTNITQDSLDNVNTLQCNGNVTKCNIDIDIDIEKEIDLEKKTEKEKSILFERFWEKYPHKIEKEVAFKSWRKRIQEGYDASDLIKAASNYAKEKQGVSLRYIKYPGNFLGDDKTFISYAISQY